MAKAPVRAKVRPPAGKSKPAAKPASNHGTHGGNHSKAAAKPAKSQPKPAAKAASKAKPEPAAAPPPTAAPATAKPVRKPRPDLLAKILHLISEEMAIEEAELTPTASFKDDLNLDAIDIAELLMQAEGSFDIHPFSEEDWETCETVGDFSRLIEKRVEAKRGKKPAKASAKA